LPDGIKLADGRYLVVKRLGSGGQAVVYDALEDVDNSLNDQGLDNTEHATACVLKEFVLPIRGGSEIKRRAIQNIQREANLLKSFDHENIVGYRDLFIEGSRAYLVMERIFGETLRRQVENKGKLLADQVIDLACKMCDLLEFLHCSDPPIIHRDFTPENLMLTGDGKLKLIDFNVAHRLESSSTRTVVGKHAYVPPEQFRGKPTAQSDIYALGATLYFLLTGVDPEPISRSDLSGDIAVPLSLAQIIMKATEPNAAERYFSASELKSALDSVLSIPR
jgi:serine/threonine protein kinase, bacterial